MTILTDPARELADVCTKLQVRSNEFGESFLSKNFDVDAWSAEFYNILFVISKRTDELIGIVNLLEMDADFRNEATNHILQVKRASSLDGLRNQWSYAVDNFITPANVNPIKMLSAQVRMTHSYPKLNETELTELIAQVDELIIWLREHQLREQDFIRQILIDGLHQFRFCLQRIGCLGWGYTLQTLLDIIGAYLARERGISNAIDSPVDEAALRKVGLLIKSVFEKVTLVKSIFENADFIIKAYGAITLLMQGTHTVAGLLTSR